MRLNPSELAVSLNDIEYTDTGSDKFVKDRIANHP